LIDIPTLSAVVAATSVVVGVAAALLELDHMAKTRRTDVIMRIYERFSTREMVGAMNLIGRRRFAGQDAPSQEELTAFAEIATIFEGLGVMLEQKLIDIKLLDSLFGPTLDYLWQPMEPLVKGMRESLNQSYFFSHFEFLHDSLAEYRRRKS